MPKNIPSKLEIELLRKLEQVIKKLPFGEHQALPWCRESFPELDLVMKELDQFNNNIMKED